MSHLEPCPVRDDDLTDRQREFLGFLIGFDAARRPMPSMREIGARFGITSPNGVMCHLKALEKKGWIERTPGSSRSIVILKRPGVKVPGRLESLRALSGRFDSAALTVLARLDAPLLASIAAALDAASP